MAKPVKLAKPASDVVKRDTVRELVADELKALAREIGSWMAQGPHFQARLHEIHNRLTKL